MSDFKQINVESITDNTFKLIDKDWFLITAGNKNNFNTMTASWGTFGILWHKPIVIAFIRPQRHTYQFAEKFDHFTTSFFDETYRETLKFCGTKSGKNVDKIKETGLSPAETKEGNIYFKEARLVLECKKIYYDDLKPEHFLVDHIQKNYPKNDYHRFYIGEIINCLKK
jgi:flavin reductase (DIM6/NTAB) family NADH-FMN oxidoreductase RutF